MKQSKDEGQAFVAGMEVDEKLHLTCVVIGVSGATNRHQMGILVNALRDQDEKTKFVAVGICLDVTFTEQSTGKKTDAIYVLLEDRDGNPQVAVFPYNNQFPAASKPQNHQP